MDKIQMILQYVRSTKGTHIFGSKAEYVNPPIETIYIQKEHFKGIEPPKFLSITIEKSGG